MQIVRRGSYDADRTMDFQSVVQRQRTGSPLYGTTHGTAQIVRRTSSPSCSGNGLEVRCTGRRTG
ncbi:MAG: hypothetical protein ACKOBW_18580 [Planctomycetota bacterium]